MLSSVTHNWWMFALRGALAVIFGVAAFVWPGITFEAPVLLFGVYALLDGVLVLSFGLTAAGDGERWWPLVLGGILGIGLGVVTFARPAAMGEALVYVVAFWAIVAVVQHFDGDSTPPLAPTAAYPANGTWSWGWSARRRSPAPRRRIRPAARWSARGRDALPARSAG